MIPGLGTATFHFARGEISLRAASGDAVLLIAVPPVEAQRLARELSRALIASGVLNRRTGVPAGACPGKRAYPSAEAAKLANRSASWRFRVYACRACGAFHVTAAEKGGGRRKHGRERGVSK